MPWDTNLILKAAGAETASASQTAKDLGVAVPNKGQLSEFRLFFTALDRTTGDERYDVIIEESDDNTNFLQVTQFRQLALGTSPADQTFTGIHATGKQMVRFGLVTKRYVRSRSVIAGTTPSVTYSVRMRGVDAVAKDVDRLWI